MKSDWTTKKLLEIVDLNPRESIPKGSIAKKVGMDKLQPFCRDVMGYELTEFTGGTKFRNNDTIMARITPCLENGKTAKINILNKNEIGFGSTEYIVFRAKKGVSDANFIYYLVCSPIIREPAIKSMVGSSGRQRVQIDVIQNIEINIPPYTEQIEIVSILQALDNKIALNMKTNNNLEQQAQAIYADMFLSKNNKQWTTCNLSNIAEITMGQSPKGSSYNEDRIGTIFFQGRAEFGFRFPTVRLYTTEPRRLARMNDVLISVRAPVGDLNVAHTDCCIGRGLAAIHSKDNHQSYILYTMFSIRSKLDVFNGEGTVFGSINKNSLNAMQIKQPPKELMDKFESIVSPMDALIRSNNDEIYYLQELRDNLLPKLMSGELDVSNINI